MVDHGLPREGLAVRLFEQIDRGYERYDQDGPVDRHGTGAPSHGDRRHARKAGNRSQGSKVEEYPGEDEWYMRYRRSWIGRQARRNNRQRRYPAE